ncbi:GTPase IMAP family member 9-like [Brachyhypopomus gauderio]|uniref:GTPase IMAP family member 9-like n=1 Tax=Brachyhypopomus gauderio TaxID=698409 RepID=UPI0040425837
MHSHSQQRILLVGRSGDGITSTRNTIMGNKTSESNDIQRLITVVEAPGLFDTRVTNTQIQYEIEKCVGKCTPGLHAILIILKVGRYTTQERRIFKEIEELFGEEVLKYSIVLFTNGDQLEDGQTIGQFVRQSRDLQDLVDQCGGRVHVVDNKYWKEQQDGYRSNRVQVEKLLNTIEEMVKENGGECYTNEMLQDVRKNKEQGKTKLFWNIIRWVKKNIHRAYLVAVIMSFVLAVGVYCQYFFRV